MAPFDAGLQSVASCAIVSVSGGRFGFAVFFEDQRDFRICEYQEDSHASRTEALFLQVQPRSCCVAPQSAEDARKLGRVAESCGVELKEVKAAELLKKVDLEQDLLRLLCDTEGCGLSRHLEEQRLKQGMRALGVLIAHTSLTSEPANFGACTLGLYSMANFMYLDKAAFSALNVLPKPEESLRANTSIMGFLNRCRSSLGMRRLRQWLTQPLTSAQEISRRHDVVEALCSTEELLRTVEGHFRHVPDLEQIAVRLHRVGTKSTAQKATLEDLVSLYQSFLGTESIVRALDTYRGKHQEHLSKLVIQPLRSCCVDGQNFISLVKTTIDLQQAEQRNYCINSAFDPSLGQLAEQRDAVKGQMEELRKVVESSLKLAEKANQSPVSLVEALDGSMVFRVTKKHQQAVQNGGKAKYKPVCIKKMEFTFTTTELEGLNKQYREAIGAYDKQSAQLSLKAIAVGATYRPVVERMAESLGSLDVLAAFARVALTAPCSFVRAQMDASGKEFSIKAASHMLVVANSDKGFVTNNLDMSRDDSRLHLITGPNMGGKSTYIRSVAIIALLNQIGSFVPCQSATLPVFDAIMCRVGASDMQLRGISTFMAEMLEAACILNTATERALVIVDELGRGTSTSDGFGIAWAIARHLVEKTRCYSLFATHFHELAALETATEGVRNRRATATVDPLTGQLTFLYALADGAADQSYGPHVAEIAGFPSAVVQSARKRAQEFEVGGQFGQPTTKRKRIETPSSDASARADIVNYVAAAGSEEDFVLRAKEQLPRLREVLAN